MGRYLTELPHLAEALDGGTLRYACPAQIGVPGRQPGGAAPFLSRDPERAPEVGRGQLHPLCLLHSGSCLGGGGWRAQDGGWRCLGPLLCTPRPGARLLGDWSSTLRMQVQEWRAKILAFVLRLIWALVSGLHSCVSLGKPQSLSEPLFIHLGRDHAPGIDVGSPDLF